MVRVNTTIFDTNSTNKSTKLVSIDFINQGEYFDINYNNIELIFTQIIAKMCAFIKSESVFLSEKSTSLK